MSMCEALRQMPERSGRVPLADGEAGRASASDEATRPRHETGSTGSALLMAALTRDNPRQLREAALYYHRHPKPGKIAVTPIKQLTNQYDLSMAYSPGVAFACEEIVADPREASTLTSRANLVGVITNGTAVLGLGAIGPLAAKPVMEGKGVLFKKFANIDVFDIEIDERDPDKLINTIASLEPTFGGINLEDIKAPECFYIERKLRERMKIPVFHDDQHGTAIVVGAAVLNGLHLIGKAKEIVARTQYLGKVKRHLFRLLSSAPLKAGDEIYSPDNLEQACGKVMTAAPAPAGGYTALAVVQSNHADTLHLGARDGAQREQNVQGQETKFRVVECAIRQFCNHHARQQAAKDA